MGLEYISPTMQLLSLDQAASSVPSQRCPFLKDRVTSSQIAVLFHRVGSTHNHSLPLTFSTGQHILDIFLCQYTDARCFLILFYVSVLSLSQYSTDSYF